MLPFNAARELIKNDQPIQAIELLLPSLQNSSLLNDFILISGQLKGWKADFQGGIDPPKERWNFSVYALLALITNLEIQVKGESKRLRLRQEIEQELVDVYEKMDKIDSPQNRSEEVLSYLHKHYPKVYIHLVNLAAGKDRLRKLWENPDLTKPELLSLLRTKENELSEAVSDLAAKISNLRFSNPPDAMLLSTLVKNNIEFALAHEAKYKHGEACKKKLIDRVNWLEGKKEELLKTGTVGLLFFSLGFAASDSAFGKGFDNDGYDSNGFDPDGFNRHGLNENGTNHFGYNHQGMSDEMVPSEGIYAFLEDFFAVED